MAAANTDLLTKVGLPGSATTLASPGHTIGGTSITVDSTSLWPTDTGVIFGMDTVTLVSGEEVRDTGTYTVWEGVVTSATGIGSMVLKYGTDQNYPAGSTTRVYILPSVIRENQVVEWGLEEHDQDGTHGAVTATSLATDTITELTAASGVTIDSVLLKDGKVATSGAVDNTSIITGMPVQMASVSSNATTSGTTVLPVDNTIPQSGEGIEVMTLTITPKSATNILVIEAFGLMGSSVANNLGMALFQDSTADALTATNHFQSQSAGDVNLSLMHRMVAGTTSATTFKIRIGGNSAGTTTWGNGRYSTVPHGMLKITEYKAS